MSESTPAPAPTPTPTKTKFEIRNRWTDSIIFAHEGETIKEAVEAELLASVSLSDADLRGADLSDADLRGANLSDADLSDANLRGADLSDADLRGANLSDANLCGADLSDADLSDANLRGADLSDADLSDANLRGADLSDANLCGADLSDANLRKLLTVPSLHRRILAAIEAGGNLDMGAWHIGSCGTTHCRAGWAIHLAGDAGYTAEALLGPNVAGALIHTYSSPALEGKVPNFYASNEDAMKDIERLAALEPELV